MNDFVIVLVFIVLLPGVAILVGMVAALMSYKRIKQLQDDVLGLKSVLKRLQRSQAKNFNDLVELLNQQSEQPAEPAVKEVVPEPVEKEQTELPAVEQVVVMTPEPKAVPKTPPPVPVKQQEQSATAQAQTEAAYEKARAYAMTHEPVPEREPSELEKNFKQAMTKIWNWITVGEEFRKEGVSLEYAVASTWLMRAAIIIILTGIGFFLKYSIDNNLIGPQGRVACSIAAGIGMLGVGYKLAGKKYDLIGQGILGVGLATLYFSFFAGFNMYQLIPMIPAFLLMILVTVTASIIAMRLNSMFVAVVGIVGGFATPVMLSTGQVNFVGLYSYLLLLGAGTLLIAYRKDWKLLNLISFGFTYLFLFATYFRDYEPVVATFAKVYPFAIGFYLLFSFLPLLYNIMHKQKANLLDLGLLFGNNCLFFLFSGLILRTQFDLKWLALVAVILAAYQLIQIHLFMKRQVSDRNLLFSLVSFASFFIIVAVPLALSKEWISASWAAMAFMFLWFSLKVKSNLLKNVAFIIYVLTFGRLVVFDSAQILHLPEADLYFRTLVSRLMSCGSFILSIVGGYVMLKKENLHTFKQVVEKENDIPDAYKCENVMTAFLGTAFIGLFIYLHVEFYYLAKSFFPAMQMALLSAIWIGAIVCLFNWYLKKKDGLFATLCMVFSVGLLIKFVCFDLAFWKFSYWHYQGFQLLDSAMRLLDFAPAIALFAVIYFMMMSLTGKARQVNVANFFGISALTLLFLYLSLELNTCLLYNLPTFRTGGISILWGVYALALLIGGFRKQITGLRYAGLLLFLIISFKIFFFDLARLDQFYRIVAFIILGLVIMGGAVIYVKFREIFTNEKVVKGVEHEG